ncbi:hypothetical protein RQL50_21465 [Citrobacter freundii]|uniref:hypothetical protein n=1 Tax=Citrobacter freundii TaxID=546 RepID=UPI0028BE3CBB|nr:hypothetical protein [Citrobacter freundii]MDT7423672.1 hypothetical protein [Citrobacter freundii]
MDISNILPSSGIKKVLIIDDDTKIFYTKEAFTAYGVEEEIIDKLEDEDDPNTSQLISLLDENGLPYDSLRDKISSFSRSEISENIPEHFKEKIVKVITQSHEGLYHRIKTVKKCLSELGIEDSDIKEVGTSEEAENELLENSYNLIIVDLMLSEDEKSLDLLRRILQTRKSHDTQFILTSYRTEELKNNYRSIHIDNHISSAKLKVLDKPSKVELNSIITWKHALIQISHERQFMHELQQCQKDWVECIMSVSKSLSDKIWTLDSCYINKLRMTAEADHLSFSEYLSEAMAKNMVSEYENSESPIKMTDDLANKIKNTENSDFIFGYSLETVDPYEKLKILISDLTSHRPNKLLKFPTSDKESNVENVFRSLLSCLKFGTILKFRKPETDEKKDKASEQYYVHLTPPCDYIHLNFKDKDQESLLFFPGQEYSVLKSEGKSEKIYQTPYVNVDGDIKNLRWNLRNPTSYTIGRLLSRYSNFEVVGQLRTEYAQAIIQKFSSSASRIATPRLPIFDNICVYHITYKVEEGFEGFYISTYNETIKQRKLNIAKIENKIDIVARKFRKYDIGNDKVIFPGESASRIAELTYDTQEKIDEICINMMYGVELLKNEEVSLSPELYFIMSEDFNRNKKSILQKIKDSDNGDNKFISYVIICE